MTRPLRLGRIGFMNVLPIYRPLETGQIAHGCQLISGPPSVLNELMDKGELDISASSSIEYGRHARKYYLVPDLAIGSRGPVQSVLLKSRVPVRQLDKKTILSSSQTHTSAALLRLLIEHSHGLDCGYRTGDVTGHLARGDRPDAFLAIGDEALRLRNHPDYPHGMDLGRAWLEWTGLPFIFGVWIVRREAFDARPDELRQACAMLQAAKRAGAADMDAIRALAALQSGLGAEEIRSYFDGLVYDLGEEEQKGLGEFFRMLKETGDMQDVPRLEFVPGSG